jgi:hypothetical protein
MSEVTHRIELAQDGYEKIEAKIQDIEALANEGIFYQQSRNASFYQILSETKKLRQILRDVLLIVPAVVVSGGKGGAA